MPPPPLITSRPPRPSKVVSAPSPMITSLKLLRIRTLDAPQAVAGSGAGAQGAQVASEIKADHTEAGIRHRVDALTAEHPVVAVGAVRQQQVVAVAADQLVAAATSIDEVGAVAAEEVVIGTAGADIIVAGSAKHHTASDDCVVAVAAVNEIESARRKRRC